ncbi:MAG: plasmid recombination protein [Prevotella sp.]|nr:plasmid recombination protein [Prevotella sp.]
MEKIQKQSIDMRGGKRMPIALSNENLRIGAGKAWSAKVAGTLDPTRTRLDFEVGKGGMVKDIDQSQSIPKRVRTILNAHGIQDPNLGRSDEELKKSRVGIRTYASFVIQGSHDTMLNLAFGEQQVDFSSKADNSHLTRDVKIEQWAKDVYNFMAKKYGEDNIASFVVHLDETTPHAYCIVVPITDTGELSFRKVFVGEQNDKFAMSKQTKQLWDEMASISQKYGLARGDDKLTTGAKHKSYLQWMREQVEENEKTISAQSLTIAAQQQELYDLNREVKGAEIRLKGLNTMLENLDKHRLDVLAEIEILESEAADNESENSRVSGKIERLKAELQLTEEKIKSRKEQFLTATEQLRDLNHRRADLQHDYDDMMRRINRTMPTLQEKTYHDMEAFAWEEAALDTFDRQEQLEEFREALSDYPFLENKFNKLYEGSFAEVMATKCTEVTVVASALFLGYVDQATQYAESLGGGGGASSDWGRKKNEDDRTFAHRCLLMARNMLQPSKEEPEVKQERRRGYHR